MPTENLALLQEVNRSGAWFAAQKTQPLWARKAGSSETVESREGLLQASPGDYICRGLEGEFWVQAESTLRSKYQETGQAAADAHGQMWSEFAPIPQGSGVMAAQIGHDFEVHASWGLLAGKPGDYLVKSSRDRDIEFPGDVWVVDQAVFEATYQRS